MTDRWKPSKRWIFAVIVILGTMVVGATWFARHRVGQLFASNGSEQSGDRQSVSGSVDAVQRVHVAVAPVGTIQPPESYLRFRGEVRARRDSELAFRRSGRLQSVAVHEGDFVAAGDVLAELDVSDLRVAEQMAKAQLQAADARLRQAEAGPRAQTVLAAEAQVRQMQAQLASAEEQLRREQILQRRGAGSQQSLDTARFDVQRLEASVAQALSRLEELREGTRSEQIDIARAEVAAAEAALEKIRVDQSDSRLVAPFDAVVARRMIDEGMIVGSANPVLHLLESPPLEARFGLPVQAAARLSLGQKVRVQVGFRQDTELDRQHYPSDSAGPRAAEVPRCDRCPETDSPQSDRKAWDFLAEVVRIQPQLDPVTRTRGVDVRLFRRAGEAAGANTSIAIVGQPANLWLPEPDASEQERRAFWVPSAALVRGARGLWSVYVAAEPSAGAIIPSAFEDTVGRTDIEVQPVDAVVSRRDVRIVRTAGTYSLVRGMIRRGELMVVDGVHRIGPGVAVTAVRGSDDRLVDQLPRWASAERWSDREKRMNPEGGGR